MINYAHFHFHFPYKPDVSLMIPQNHHILKIYKTSACAVADDDLIKSMKRQRADSYPKRDDGTLMMNHMPKTVHMVDEGPRESESVI